MIKVDLTLSAIIFCLWVYTLVEVISTPEPRIRQLPKVGWVVVVLLLPLLGTILWWVVGRPESPRRPSAYERSRPDFPEYDRPGRAAAADPEKDEEFLRQLRERAEEQRRRHERAKLQEELREQRGPEPPPGDAAG